MSEQTPSEQQEASQQTTTTITSENTTTAQASDATGAGTPSEASGVPAADSSTVTASESPATSEASNSLVPASNVPPSEQTAEPSAASSPSSPSAANSATGKSATSVIGKSGRSSPGGSTTGQQRSSKKTASAGASRPRGQKLGQLKTDDAKIGVIGAGKMADALVQGLIHYGKIQADKIHVAAPSAKNLETFKNYGCHVTRRNYDIFGRYDCDIIFLCFHGHVIKNCYKLGGTRPHPITTNYIPHQRHPIYILSMVSGVSLAQIKACLLNPESTNRYVLEIHRIMMNTAVGQGLGICAVDCEPDSKKLSAPLRQILSSISHLEYVPASQMDAACAIGGSGLAFSYYFINALADGAFKMGLSRKQAIRFASKTAQCAAQTLLESGKHPAELRDTVSAPSGAAIYGIHVLEKNDVASGVTAAVEAAHKRASELADKIPQ